MPIHHRERVQCFNKKHSPPPDTDDKVLQLLEAIRSGQVSPSQIVAHVEAGDIQASDLNTGDRDESF